jgi:hypothetical protein
MGLLIALIAIDQLLPIKLKTVGKRRIQPISGHA